MKIPMEKFVQSKSSVILNTIGLTSKILQGCKASTNKKKRLSHVGTTPKKMQVYWEHYYIATLTAIL